MKDSQTSGCWRSTGQSGFAVRASRGLGSLLYAEPCSRLWTCHLPAVMSTVHTYLVWAEEGEGANSIFVTSCCDIVSGFVESF